MNDRLTEPKFKHRLLANFFVRFHMTLILASVCLSGLSVSKLLLALGVRLMFARYLIAVCIAYAIFFLLIRLWLWYIGLSPRARTAIVESKNHGSSSIGDGFSFDISTGKGGHSSSNWQGFGGGSSGGGGASDSWGEATTSTSWMAAPVNPAASSGGSFNFGSSSSASSSGGSKDSFFDFDFGDDGCLPIVVLLLLVALIFGIFGAGAYLIYQAPAILTEVAFQVALASGLIKASKNIDAPNWRGSVFKATWLPFLIVLALTAAFSLAAHRYCPTATKATEVFQVCKQ